MIEIPELALVALIGISGSGKSTFARRHFAPTKVLSSDAFRAMVADDENDMAATADAFELLHFAAGKRLRTGRLTVVDATNVQPHARAALVRTAREHDVLPVAIVLDVPVAVCWERTLARTDRTISRHVLTRQHRDLHRSLGQLGREGFRQVHLLAGAEQVDAAAIRFTKLYSDRKELAGPFDIIGDVHGCREELESLLAELGWRLEPEGRGAFHPDGRTAVFVGDLVDRGPDSPGVLRLVMRMVAAGTALCVAGNHEQKLLNKLRGRKVPVSHGLAETLDQLAAQPAGFVAGATEFLDGLASHYVLDGGALVVAHAGPKKAYHRGAATVVYGHTPIPTPEWVNNTICLDTGCVFGGRLTALRYPERELVSVPAGSTRGSSAAWP